MVVIETGAFVIEGTPSDEWEILLRVNAPFCLRVEGFTLVDEPSFPVVELAKALRGWEGRGSFEYRSVESDISPLLLIETEMGFYIASPLSKTCADVIIDRGELLSVLMSFVQNIRQELLSRGIPLIL